EDRLRQPAEKRGQGILAVILRPVETRDQSAGAFAPRLARERVHGGYGLQPDKGAELLRCRGYEVAIPAHDLPGVSGVPEDRPGIDHLHRMRLEEKTRHPAEIAAAATESPE